MQHALERRVFGRCILNVRSFEVSIQYLTSHFACTSKKGSLLCDESNLHNQKARGMEFFLLLKNRYYIRLEAAGHLQVTLCVSGNKVT